MMPRAAFLAFLVVLPSCSRSGGGFNDGDSLAPGGDASAGDEVSLDGATAPSSDATGIPQGQDGPAPISCNSVPTRGANVPYQEYEAENAATTGAIIGPSRAVNDPD